MLPPANQENLTLLPANQETVTLPPANQVTAPLATSTTLHLQFSVPGTPFLLHCSAHSVAFSRPGSAMSSSGKLCVTQGRREEHWPSWTLKAQPHPILQAGIRGTVLAQPLRLDLEPETLGCELVGPFPTPSGPQHPHGHRGVRPLSPFFERVMGVDGQPVYF